MQSTSCIARPLVVTCGHHPLWTLAALPGADKSNACSAHSQHECTIAPAEDDDAGWEKRRLARPTLICIHTYIHTDIHTHTHIYIYIYIYIYCE